MDLQAQRIVQEALSLRISHPDVPAIETLDLVMIGHHGSDVDFEDPDAPVVTTRTQQRLLAVCCATPSRDTSRSTSQA